MDGELWTDEHTETAVSTNLERFFLNKHGRMITSRVISIRLNKNFPGAEFDAKVTAFTTFFQYRYLPPRYFHRFFLKQFLQFLVRPLLGNFQAETFYSPKSSPKI